ncbi:MAG: hypothetical protein JXQ93_08325 [Flavobacteriaceae bacterium]
MNKNIFFLLIVLLLSNVGVNAQNEDNRWVVGVSSVLTSYGTDGERVLGERYSSQVLKLNVSRYFFKGLTLDAGMVLSPINEVKGFINNNFSYFSLDGTIRYDFNTSDENWVPYVGLGLSVVGAPSNVSGAKRTGTMNAVLGTTFWFSPRVGFNAQMMYKRAPSNIISMVTHTQVSAGLVFSLNRRVLNYRLWDHKY